jgi:phosphatidylserine/phosphatidylglycerophosphate/cardiolipin synthase-like enzyme
MPNTDSLIMDEPSLALLISEFVKVTPPEIVQGITNEIEEWGDSATDLQKTKLLSSIHCPQTKSKLTEMFECWTTAHTTINPQSFALSIQSSSLTYQACRFSPVELIWTGPENLSTSFRRTDQALLELITEAKEQLLVVSFAVYKAQPIIDAIEKAILRDVKVSICLEDSSEAQGKLSLSGSKAFSSSIFRLANIFIWPIENRPHTLDGKYGSLHAKLAVADCKKVFISSANLTDYAMELNMEMGVFIDDGGIGIRITDLFNDLILNSTFRNYPHP